tara:strand:- start:6931 stop:7770 length:840 start_codon:yes stop_codon:yes gene_type:complete
MEVVLLKKNKLKNYIGIVQGRLSKKVNNQIQAFPKNWSNEFKLINKIGYDGIELIYDNYKNPFLSKSYQNKLTLLSEKYSVKLMSLSCDFSMHNPLFEKNRLNTINIIKKLIDACVFLKIPRIGLSFEDKSSIRNEKNMQLAMNSLKLLSSYIKNKKIIITLETDLNVNNILNLLKQLNTKKIKINFDLGNTCAEGNDPLDYLKKIKAYVYSIHIKDRNVLFGKTVALGKGDVDFSKCLNYLFKNNFHGDIIIQGARGKDDYKTAKKYFKFIRNIIDKN